MSYKDLLEPHQRDDLSDAGKFRSGLWRDTNKTCQKHGEMIIEMTIPNTGKVIQFCKACTIEEKDKKHKMDVDAYEQKELDYRSYDILKRESIVPRESVEASLETYTVDNWTTEEARQFAKDKVRMYLAGLSGNVLFVGKSGAGKTHLAMSIAKAVNDGFKRNHQAKKVLFVNMGLLVQKIYGSRFGELDSRYSFEHWTKLMTDADVLVLDDIGKESGGDSRLNTVKDGVFRMLYDVLSNRDNTIITTNLSSEDLIGVYGEPLVSRMLAKSGGNIFTFDEKAKDRRR